MIETKGCPSCRSKDAKAVRYTWWGGAIGPKILSHVKCAECSVEYNAKTGRSNSTNIVIYAVVTLSLLGALIWRFAA